MVDKDRDWGDFNGEPGGYFVPGAIFSAADGMDTNKLVRVLVVLVNARGVWKNDCRRNILLVIKVGKRRQGAR